MSGLQTTFILGKNETDIGKLPENILWSEAVFHEQALSLDTLCEFLKVGCTGIQQLFIILDEFVEGRYLDAPIIQRQVFISLPDLSIAKCIFMGLQEQPHFIEEESLWNDPLQP